MVLLRKAENLTEAYRLLDPQHPLTGKELERFYAERPYDLSIVPLWEKLEVDDSGDDKTLFTGHRGNGKTTELAWLAEKLKADHIVVTFDAETQFNLGDVDYRDLLVLLGLEVYRAAKADWGVSLDQKRVSDLLFWYGTHILEEDEKRRWESEAGGELNAGFAKFNLKLKTEAPERTKYRSQVESHLSDLIERLNAVLDELRRKTGRRIMIIVDGLEKMYDLKQVGAIYCQGANALMAPHCRVVYTVPLSLYHTNDLQQVQMSFTRAYALPNVKTAQRDQSPYPEGWETCRRVLDNRLMPGLISTEAADRLVELSGGLLKQLISLAGDAVMRARRLRGEQGPVEPDDVEFAATKVRNSYRGNLTEAHYAELERIYRGGAFVNSPVAQDLLHNLSLLEYNGGEAWWAVNPIVRKLLDERHESHTSG